MLQLGRFLGRARSANLQFLKPFKQVPDAMRSFPVRDFTGHTGCIQHRTSWKHIGQPIAPYTQATLIPLD
jgi:hypothetical protein